MAEPAAEDFGHEPMDVITNGKLRTVECFRCQGVTWPCTSAIVLGLVPREVMHGCRGATP